MKNLLASGRTLALAILLGSGACASAQSPAMQTLETELAQLRQAASQTRNEMSALRQQIDHGQPWYASPQFAQVLALLVLAAAAAAAVLGLRARRVGVLDAPWYRQAQADAVDSMFDAPAPAPAPAAHAARVAQPAPAAVPAPPQGAEAKPRGTTSEMRVATLAATFEEAEFLASLGLTSDAMDVLKTYVADSASPSPFAYFELMRLCDHAGDAAAVGAVRRRYAQVFGREAPRLEQVLAPSGLESHQDLSEGMVRAWGTGEALTLIEQSLFDPPGASAPLSLQAGRDLICLHGVATTLAAAPTGFDDHGYALAPWADAGDVHQALAGADDTGEFMFALDVDLDVTVPELVEQDSAAPMQEALSLQLQDQQEAARIEAERMAAENEEAFSAAVAASERAR